MTIYATRIHAVFLLVFLYFFPLCTPFLWAKSTPLLNNGKKWRIGYYEGGPYSEYTDTMRTLVNGLIETGWIQESKPPALFSEVPKPYWNWLSQCDSTFLSFKTVDSYSANWDEQKRSKIKKLIIKKLNAGQLDLIIAMGTWAGMDLANDEHSVPTIVLSTSDPIQAGIIKSTESSGFEHVTARIDPSRYLRQIRMFHRIVEFHTMGIAYENTPDGQIYSAIKEVNQIAEERGFSVIACEVIDATTDQEKADRSCIECYRQLTENVDAVYVTALTCVDRLATDLADIFKEAGVASFSMIGSKYVKRGLMLSISSDSGYTELGRYNAMKVGEILNGTRPITLKQVFEDPLAISVNMETTRQIGFEMPKSILKIADEIYEQ